ncbi:ATP synthase subunit I [Aedoeadaptatus urinae]|uniref:ATP synthase subunit I n=1 Tax=Aedoeadaptatus urinae TaxID=1871017 RepID=UPI00097DEC3B|nr:ATP synthase subunit I [Peptoniphilus urinae]
MKDRFTNEYIALTAGLALVVSGVLLVALRHPKPAVLGWIFGCLIAMAMFKLMYLTLLRALDKPEAQAARYTGIHYLLRFAIYAVVLIVAAKAEYLSLVGTFFGLLSVKYVILFRNMFDYLRSKKGGGF